jgi:DNA-directed RNA polymerase subunit D
MMELKKISSDEKRLRFLISGTDSAFVNAIRRTAMSRLPALAIEQVLVYENTSVIYDEFLANRLGLVPLKADVKKAGEKVKFSLEKEGPAVVYSGDLKTKAAGVEVADKKIPLVDLMKGQKLRLEAEAFAGSGNEHTKWQTALVTYNELPVLKADAESGSCKESVKACPTNVLEVKGSKIVLKNPYGCILCGKCEDVCEKDSVRIEGDRENFVMSVESFGSTGSREIAAGAAENIAERVSELKKEIKKL